MSNTTLSFRFCSEKLEFSIAQKDFFEPIEIRIPIEKLVKLKTEIIYFFDDWKKEIEYTKKRFVIRNKPLARKVEINENFYLELQEGIGNRRNDKTDRFGIYENFDEPFLLSSTIKVIVIPFWFVPELIDIINKGENFEKQVIV